MVHSRVGTLDQLLVEQRIKLGQCVPFFEQILYLRAYMIRLAAKPDKAVEVHFRLGTSETALGNLHCVDFAVCRIVTLRLFGDVLHGFLGAFYLFVDLFAVGGIVNYGA